MPRQRMRFGLDLVEDDKAPLRHICLEIDPTSIPAINPAAAMSTVVRPVSTRILELCLLARPGRCEDANGDFPSPSSSRGNRGYE